MTAAWEPAFTDWWHGWWETERRARGPGAPVTAVSRSTDKLDVFVAGTTARLDRRLGAGVHGLVARLVADRRVARRSDNKRFRQGG